MSPFIVFVGNARKTINAITFKIIAVLLVNNSIMSEGELDDGTMLVYDDKEIPGSKGTDNKVKAIVNGINNINIDSPPKIHNSSPSTVFPYKLFLTKR